MTQLQAVFLGLIQGLTEFLPVSSSGHLQLARRLMELGEVPALFDIVLHLATLAVVIQVFRKRIGAILCSVFRFLSRRTREDDGPHLRLAAHLILASALTAVVGLGLSRLELKDSPRFVGAMMLITAAVLLLAQRSAGPAALWNLGWRRSVILGMAQGLGVLPGISRSGITIGAGLLCGLDRPAAGEFSFLLSIPAIIGAFVFSLGDVEELTLAVPVFSLIIGFITALVAGYASLRFLLRLVAHGRLWVFALYLVPVGLWALIRFPHS